MSDWTHMTPTGTRREDYREEIERLEVRVAELEAEVERLKDQLREPCNDAEFGMKP